MARRFIDDVRAEISASNQLVTDTIYTNDTKEISGDDIQAPMITHGDCMLDLADSCIQDEAQLVGNSEIEDVNLNANWLSLGAGIYTGSSGNDADFLKIDQANGKITTATTAGFSYTIFGQVALQAVLLESIEFAVGFDGVPVGFINPVIGVGTNDGLAGTVRYFSRSTPSDTEITLMLRAPDGSATIDILETIELSVVVLPTNNPS